ncbi:hypothetical protein LPJ77_002830 [Coemansia sp. RSA 2523]|nr:hypothetical protein LPJ54_002385 [Coemansia sp. RSA 1824]KAJ1788618.1 hypothetical protein LPJ62_002791 [Coemansia sp. RSA 2167]KAJ1807720.1 hypothetical protein LPJ77_002830 [Coemansia sp. RSA 2523]KAJ2128064.1 hypothetical protein GGH17_004527 [Coemansia sp. RSA 788]KAJ2242705.1 hypothetical protein GGH98_005300 [Coemansia sp. RSA 454]KAJ2421292.1 hypothetical protein GGF47_004022 [Coemansia sp. RSA 2524]KAJ2641254.1 hypothetical protein IW137_003153 [Coemansia sp. RSA 1287]KAJ2715858.
MTLSLTRQVRRPVAVAVSALWRRRGLLRAYSAHTPDDKGPDVNVLMRTLPPKPEPPGRDDCCMSGCEYCVWDLYDEDMHEYQKHATAIREALEAKGMPVPQHLRPESLRDSVDPSMRAFLDMERQMEQRIKDQEDQDDS